MYSVLQYIVYFCRGELLRDRQKDRASRAVERTSNGGLLSCRSVRPGSQCDAPFPRPGTFVQSHVFYIFVPLHSTKSVYRAALAAVNLTSSL